MRARVAGPTEADDTRRQEEGNAFEGPNTSKEESVDSLGPDVHGLGPDAQGLSSNVHGLGPGLHGLGPGVKLFKGYERAKGGQRIPLQSPLSFSPLPSPLPHPPPSCW